MPKQERKRTINDVLDRVEYEGFDYCFISYSSFEDVEDEKFHKLRKAYIKAHAALEDYLEKFREDDEG